MNKQLPVAGQLNADVYETPGGDAYMIEVPVPGLKPDEILVEVSVDTITVRTQPRQAGQDVKRTYLQREQSLQPMSRIFDFPMDLDTDNVHAALEYGILRIRAPKALAGRQRVIRVGQAA